jgi:hypothetical protein
MEPDERKRVADEWLDAGLKQYGQAEPRPGLENRILAGLRSERERMLARKWQWWPALAALTAIFLIGIGVFLIKLRNAGVHAPLAKESPASFQQKTPQARQADGSRVQDFPGQRIHTGVQFHPHHVTEHTATARLEQFPSPHPLSEQEAILQRYAEQFPREASLMAQAQTQLTRQEMIERETPPGNELLPNPEPQNQ